MKCRVFSPVKKGLWTKPEQFSSFSPSPGQSDLLGSEMKSLNLPLLFLLFFSGQIQGSTGMIQTFLPTELELTLSLTGHNLLKNYTVVWFDHLNRTIATYYSYGETKVEPHYEGKVKLLEGGALMFLSPQESDSGVYFAKVIEDVIQTMKFNIKFHASPGELKVDVVSNSSFNITITCSMEDVDINGTFICENNICHMEGGERSKVTKSGASFRLYLLNSTITCSYSNHTSETQSKTTIQPISKSKVFYIVLGVLLGLLGFGCCVCCILKKTNCGEENSRTETSPDIPLQTCQHLLGNKVYPSRDDQIELDEVFVSQSGTSAWSGKSLQGDDEEEP